MREEEDQQEEDGPALSQGSLSRAQSRAEGPLSLVLGSVGGEERMRKEGGGKERRKGTSTRKKGE